ncbi:MAG: alpha-1,2-fucosyltransferase [Lachnospiraceae bacterium]|nr:alpha-1,2-fucosyltransferase [Lachnospiraceae bacterium]
MNIIRMSGGLGNQMFQYALYLKLRSMGKEVKFDDINEYRGENTRPIMLAVFGIDYPRATWDEIVEFTDGSMNLLKRIRRKIFGRRALEYREEEFYDPKVLSFDSMYLRGNFKSEKYFEDIAGEVRSKYRFPTLENMHLPEKLYKNTRACQDAIESTEAVGMHMYRSDSRLDEELYEGICTEKYYEGAVRFIQERYPDAFFYIFSNEPKWVKKWVEDLIASQITEDMDKDEVRKLEGRFVLVEANTEYTGYLDMLLMSKCRHNIISNSSFSWWAAWLNDNPDRLVVAPDRWMNDKDSTDVYTKGMILVNARGRVSRTVKE